MTELNNMIMKFPEGIFKGKEPRITKEYVSVLDIICIATGYNKETVRKTWKRLTPLKI